MGQLERSTSSHGKRYLTNNLKLGGTDNGSGILQVLDESGDLSVKLDYQGITLGDGRKIIGGDGILTNFDTEAYNVGFETNGSVRYGGYFLGYNTDVFTENFGNYMVFDIYIPPTFTIEEAYITLIHSPVNWDDGGTYDVWGYCRNLQAYKITNPTSQFLGAAYYSEYEILYTPTFSLISNAFGTSGFTAAIPSDSSHNTETEISNDISSALTSGINNKIAIKSGNSIPTFSSTQATNYGNIGKETGYVRAILNIIGYTK